MKLLTVAKPSEHELGSFNQVNRHAIEPPSLELLGHLAPEVCHRDIWWELRSVHPNVLLVGYLAHHHVVIRLPLKHERLRTINRSLATGAVVGPVRGDSRSSMP